MWKKDQKEVNERYGKKLKQNLGRIYFSRICWDYVITNQIPNQPTSFFLSMLENKREQNKIKILFVFLY